MSIDQIAKKTPSIITYKAKNYSVQVGANWKVQQVDEHSTFFYGPKVGKLKVGFYINSMPKKNKSYLEAAQMMKASQSVENNFTVLEEADISEANFKAFLRRASWYNADNDMTLFIRNIFTETDDHVFMLSSSIPNSPDLAALDSAIIVMMNSFRFKQVALA